MAGPGEFAHISREKVFDTRLAKVALRLYDWPEPIRGAFCDSAYAFVDLALTRRPPPAVGRFADHFPITPIGQVLFVPPGVSHWGECGMGSQRSLACFLSADVFAPMSSADWADAASHGRLNVSAPRVTRALQRLAIEVANPGFAAEAMIDAHSMVVAVELMRQVRPVPVEKVKGGLGSYRQRLLNERIEASDLPPPSVAELAEICRISVRHLLRAYSQQSAVALGEHIRARTMDRALRLLTESAMPVKDVAARCGFASSSSFAFAVRAATGSSPSALRDR